MNWIPHKVIILFINEDIFSPNHSQWRWHAWLKRFCPLAFADRDLIDPILQGLPMNGQNGTQRNQRRSEVMDASNDVVSKGISPGRGEDNRQQPHLPNSDSSRILHLLLI